MDKIVIIGSSGAGKSTLARKLSSILNIKAIHLDRVFWQRGWEEKPRDTRIDILQRLVAEKQWIIEGSYLSSSEPRLEAADTIIFLDMSPLVCLGRLIKRHLKDRGHSRPDLPMECTDKLSISLLLKALAFPFSEKRELEKKLSSLHATEVIRLQSAQEAEEFLAQLAPESVASDGQHDLISQQGLYVFAGSGYGY